MTNIRQLEHEEFLELQKQNEITIIDLRPVAAYNGWRLEGEKRGGHIPGARSLPARWAEYMDWIEVVRHKGIRPENSLVLYAYDEEESRRVAALFNKAGYDDLAIYTGFSAHWSADPDLPLELLQRHHQLVHPEWLKRVQEGKDVEHPPAGELVIVHAHYRNREAYLSGHIPGAIDMDTLALEAPETWNRRSPAELKAALEKHSIGSNSTVVLYGKYMDPDNADEFPGSAAGHIGAIRNAFIMMYAGVKDVRILNGGFHSWKDAGYDISYDDLAKTPLADFGAAIPANPQLAVDIAEAKEMIASDSADIVCVRSFPELIGEVSGYNYIEAKGRIPGAVFADCGSDAYHMENYRNFDHTTREFGEIAANWKASGIGPGKHLAFYCGTGWRGSEAWLNAWLMGWPEVSVFDGGWYEWSMDPDNPFETGALAN